MSINVTVSGNPVRINRGKMVTSYDPSKSEFEKRRIMRLEQVRQQSKDIAENIRNKIRKEKSKCLSEVEKEGEVKLKSWQARKLLELQHQYQEALEDFGLGHRNVKQVEEEEDSLEEMRQNNEKVARERGHVAAERLQIEKNEESLRRAAPVQRKKFTRDAENVRADSVTKKKVKKKKSFDADAENKVPPIIGLDSDSDSESSESERVVRKTRRVLKTHKEQQTSTKETKEQQTSPVEVEALKTHKESQTLIHQLPEATNDFSLDTRISERIKRRGKLNPQVDYIDEVRQYHCLCKQFCNCCNCPRPERKSEKSADAFEKKSDHQFMEQQIVNIDQAMTSNTANNENQVPGIVNQQTKSAATVSQPASNHQISTVVTSEPMTAQPVNISRIAPSLQPVPTLATSINEDLPLVDQPMKSSAVPGLRGGTSALHPVKSGASKSQATSQRNKYQNVAKEDRKIHSKGKTIPVKPKVTLTSNKKRPAYISTDTDPPVQFYDHPNRYSKSYIPEPQVEKIKDDQIQISPNILTDEEIDEKMRQRDMEAALRGKAALEKEKIQREYKELLRKLPALQKQERIFEIGADKEKYHMSRDRLQELEKKRQNRLDNAYEELFVRKPVLVTLPKRKTEETPNLNLAWDVDFDKSNDSRTEELNSMLRTLRSQKDDLLKEIESTLSKTAKSNDYKSKSTEYSRTKTKRKRTMDTSPTPTSSETFRSKDTKNVDPSPRKKAKTSKRIILQNTSSQTSPRTQFHSVATSPLVNSSSESCPCKDDLCEIIIKLKDDDKPVVLVNPPSLEKNVKVVTEDESKSASKLQSPEKSTSWKEQLTQSSSRSTTSTSYLEPPPSSRSEKKKKKSPESGSGQQLDPRLLTYIKKLLNMSRKSIDELTVSTASEVSTPSHSVVETPSNNPLAQLANVMRYFNIDAAQLQKQLSYVMDESSKHYNTSESVTVSSSDGDKTVFKSCTDVQEDSKKFLEYADVAASCSKKISNLTAMIEQVRAEKKKIMENSTSSSDKDLTTTSYKDLAETKQKSGADDEVDQLLHIDYGYAEKLKQLSKEELKDEQAKASSDDELLLRLQKLLDDREKQKRTVATMREKTVVADDSDKVVTLTSETKSVEESKEGKTAGVVNEKTTVSVKPTETKDPFPLFLDIPKLPKLEVPSDKKKKKPPTNARLKSIAAATGAVPHELSTIIEADSQLSTKADSPTKGKTKTSGSEVPDILTEVPTSSDDVSEMDTMETMLVSIGMEWAIPTLKKTREALAMTSSSSGSNKDSGELSLKEFLSKIASSSEASMNETQGMSIIQLDNRRTSTPIIDKKEDQPMFPTDSDISSVKESSNKSDKFYELNEGSGSGSKSR